MLCTNEGSIEDYIVGGKKLENKRCFLICVPTTAGTGSEVSNVGVFTDHKAHTKRPWVSFDFLPDIALLDPVMTYSLPPRVTVATGLDALCHAVESYWCRATNPITKSAAIMSAKLVLENLMTAFNEPKNVEARTNMCVASLLGGLAMGQTRTTACHGISYGLTTNFGIDHGTACALTLRGKLGARAQVLTDGGVLQTEILLPQNAPPEIFLTGGAELTFRGEIAL